MADEDKLPGRSWDLIDFLDEAINKPEFPSTASGFRDLSPEAVRQMAFTAGARSVVDWLVAWRDEELETETVTEAVDVGEAGTEDLSDEPRVRFPRVFGTDGDVREVSPSLRMAGDGTTRLLDD